MVEGLSALLRKGRAMKAIVIGAVAAVLLAAGMAQADFTLHGDEQLTVNTSHEQGVLWDQSCATIVPGGAMHIMDSYNSSTVCMAGGSVYDLQAHGSSTVDMSGGETYSLYSLRAYDTSTVVITGGETYSLYSLHAYDTSTVDMSGGSVYVLGASGSSTVAMSGGSVYALGDSGSSTVAMSGGSVYALHARETSTVDMSGGSVSYLNAYETSTVDMSGGSVYALNAYDTSTVTFDGQDFLLGSGLSLNGNRILGTGDLYGEWSDGTPWTVHISGNDSGVTILAIPEPATLSLLALLALSLPKRGGLAMLRRRRRMA